MRRSTARHVAAERDMLQQSATCCSRAQHVATWLVGRLRRTSRSLRCLRAKRRSRPRRPTLPSGRPASACARCSHCRSPDSCGTTTQTRHGRFEPKECGGGLVLIGYSGYLTSPITQGFAQVAIELARTLQHSILRCCRWGHLVPRQWQRRSVARRRRRKRCSGCSRRHWSWRTTRAPICCRHFSCTYAPVISPILSITRISCCPIRTPQLGHHPSSVQNCAVRTRDHHGARQRPRTEARRSAAARVTSGLLWVSCPHLPGTDWPVCTGIGHICARTRESRCRCGESRCSCRES